MKAITANIQHVCPARAVSIKSLLLLCLSLPVHISSLFHFLPFSSSCIFSLFPPLCLSCLLPPPPFLSSSLCHCEIVAPEQQVSHQSANNRPQKDVRAHCVFTVTGEITPPHSSRALSRSQVVTSRVNYQAMSNVNVSMPSQPESILRRACPHEKPAVSHLSV